MKLRDATIVLNKLRKLNTTIYSLHDASIIADKTKETMSRNQAKLDRTKNSDICFGVIFDHYSNNFFWKADWVLGSASNHC